MAWVSTRLSVARRLEHASGVWEDFLCHILSTCRTFQVSYVNILLLKLQILVHDRQEAAVTLNSVMGQGTLLRSGNTRSRHLSHMNILLLKL